MSNQKKHNTLRSTGGFTLLEVMAAMAILGIVLVAIFNAQSQSLRLSEKAALIVTATNLARARLGEIEFEILEKGFDVLQEKDSGKFADDDFKDYRWEYTTGKVTIPLAAIDTEDKTVTENPYLKMAQDMLEKSIKEIRLKVYYREGKSEDFVEIVTHFSNPKDLSITQASQSTQ